MNLTPSTEQPHDELPRPYRIAVETILAETLPDFDLASLIPSRSARELSTPSRRRWLVQVCGMSLVGAAAVAIVVSLLALRSADAWAQVVKAVQKKPWVRFRLTAPDKSAPVEIWFSPTKRIGVGRFPGSVVFLELDAHKLQRFDEKDRTIYVTDPQPFDLDQFAVLEAALEAFANGQELRQSKAEAVKLIGQSKNKGSAGNESWTDYVLDYEDVRRSPPRFRRVFRVPEGSELPVSMTEEWNWEGKKVVRIEEMDYPASGPADLFALDVPKDAKVVDTRSGEELKGVLAAYAKQQNATFDPYTATVLTTSQDWKQLDQAYHVRRDSSGHTADVIDGEQFLTFQMERYQTDGKIVPENVSRLEWWQTEVEKFAFKHSGNGDSVSPTLCPELVGYPRLGLPNEGRRALLNPKPFIGPADTVMVTVEDTKSGAMLGRYWFSPERGLLCVRSEMPDRETGWLTTDIIDAAEKSPRGNWYATQVRRGEVERSGDDLRADTAVAPIGTSVYRYLVKFD